MIRFRKASPVIPFTASQFRIGEPNAISFSTSSAASSLSNINEPTLHNQKKYKAKFPFMFHQLTFGWLSAIALLLCFLTVNGSNIVRSWEQHLVCVLPSKISQFILHTGRQCNWHQTTFSYFIPFGHDFASLNAGGMVSPRLTTLGINLVPPSAVLSPNATGVCWSFHGNSGTFGVAFNAPNVMPSHVVIHHRPSDSTASLSHAPRQVIIWGLVDGEANMRTFLQVQDSQPSFTSTLSKVPPSPISKEGIFLPLAEINFDITAQSLRQAFPLSNSVLSWGIDFGVVVVDVRSNWGADTTSLCTVQVYGHTITSSSMG